MTSPISIGSGNTVDVKEQEILLQFYELPMNARTTTQRLLIVLWLLLLCASTTNAQLTVTASPLKVTGSKAVVPLVIKNGFPEKVESARAVVFVMDDKGKVIGHGTRWVIGGTKDHPPLESGRETTFNFVVATEKPFTTTNLTAKVDFNRVVLEGGKLVDPIKDVQIRDLK